MNTQNQRLLSYLITHNSINPLEAWQELGIYRLGARIFDLKKQGYLIANKSTIVKNRFGEDCRVARYVFGNVVDTSLPPQIPTVMEKCSDCGEPSAVLHHGKCEDCLEWENYEE